MNKRIKKKKNRMLLVNTKPWTSQYTVERRVRKALNRLPHTGEEGFKSRMVLADNCVYSDVKIKATQGVDYLPVTITTGQLYDVE